MLGVLQRVYGSVSPTCDIILKFAVKGFFEVGFGHCGRVGADDVCMKERCL